MRRKERIKKGGPICRRVQRRRRLDSLANPGPRLDKGKKISGRKRGDGKKKESQTRKAEDDTSQNPQRNKCDSRLAVNTSHTGGGVAVRREPSGTCGVTAKAPSPAQAGGPRERKRTEERPDGKTERTN